MAPAVLFEAPTVEQFALRLRSAKGGLSTPATKGPPLVHRMHRQVGGSAAPTRPQSPSKSRSST